MIIDETKKCKFKSVKYSGSDSLKFKINARLNFHQNIEFCAFELQHCL